MNKCTGACCAVFWLDMRPNDFTAKWKATIRDGQYIADMVVPLTLDAAAQRAADYGVYWSPEINSAPLEDVDDLAYTCRYWDSRTRKCLSYKSRPSMCRAYPYNQLCGHCGWHGGYNQSHRRP
jgi:Fe-S-cluster containining protein